MNSKHFCHFCSHSLIYKFTEGRNRLFCSYCNQTIYENPIPATAAVVINENHEVLLVKRNAEPKAGQWCLPGGFLELEESPENGCLRELKEETGMEGEIHQWAGNVSSDSLMYKSVLVMGYSIKNTHGQLKAGDDCDLVAFFKPETMPPIAFKSHKKILENVLNFRVGKSNAVHFDLKDPGCFGAYVISSGNHIEMAKKACKSGARVFQYREKQARKREMLKTVCEIRKITWKYNTLFIVNDFIDIALLARADGVHLGQDDIPIKQAREITPPEFIIGISTHSLEQAVEAEKLGSDYIGIGPVFSTPTKEDYVPIGIDTVKQVIKFVRIPVVAIGGLNLGNIPELQKAGVKNFAMVRAFQNNTEEVILEINKSLLDLKQ